MGKTFRWSLWWSQMYIFVWFLLHQCIILEISYTYFMIITKNYPILESWGNLYDMISEGNILNSCFGDGVFCKVGFCQSRDPVQTLLSSIVPFSRDFTLPVFTGKNALGNIFLVSVQRRCTHSWQDTFWKSITKLECSIFQKLTPQFCEFFPSESESPGAG